MTKRIKVDRAALEKLREVRGWLNCTGERGFFCIGCDEKDAPGSWGLFTFGDFIEVHDGRAYGIHGKKKKVGAADKKIFKKTGA